MKVSDGYRTEMDIDPVGTLHLSTLGWEMLGWVTNQDVQCYFEMKLVCLKSG
jgi:hypothetical protein